MSFPWLQSSSGAGNVNRRLAVCLSELRDRAGLLRRLGLTSAQCADRLRANVAWDFESSARPQGLDDAAIGKLVDDVYQRQR